MNIVKQTKQAKQAFLLLLLFTLLTGLIYPVVVTLVAQVFFPWQANGSMLRTDHTVVGSLLIAQPFTDAKYFWGRPSSGANLGPSNPVLFKTLQARVQLLQQSMLLPPPPFQNNSASLTIPQTLSPDAESGLASAPIPQKTAVYPQNIKIPQPSLTPVSTLIPIDLVTDSASGVDPDISPQAAYYQIPRIAQARHLSPDKIRTMVDSLIQQPTFKILGEPRVNVLELNIMLDTLR